MSPLEIWCNEAQERYVLAIAPGRLDRFRELCERERCPYAVVGEVTEAEQLVVADRHFGNRPIDVPMALLFGKAPKMTRRDQRQPPALPAFDPGGVELQEAVKRVLRFPSVAAKDFLITIGDRTVSGLVARDQMVGPWQVPVADAAVLLDDYEGYQGQAMAMGERTPLALIDSAAAARMAVGEALTNLFSAPVASLSEVKLSANWMAAAGHPGEDAALYDAVRAVGEELCPALGIAIPVGKDSLSMRTVWDGDKRVLAPVSLIVTAFARVADVRRALTPELRRDAGQTLLVLVDLGAGKRRLGGSVLAVQEVPQEHVKRYGIVAGDAVEDGLTRVRRMVEKPSPEAAPSRLGVAGRYILTPGIFEEIRRQPRGVGGEIQLTDGIAGLLRREKVFAYRYEGVRYDCGSKAGMFQATVALGKKYHGLEPE